ncbi:hypothetical protein J8L84_19575 [Alteromonas sp. MMG017]|uniref:hypothetical protein n=1 Tax=Alteromonas sp. MMG017 TaxID=2822692 RepID=UPI001B3A41D1|nr:hypothetical protein [Alteromonas sp. MMG017]MBQ4831487.1 hypothetical protein [Alteromonas sp. MMG017]
MDTIEEYLKSTESATKKLFEGIEDYLSILYEVKKPVFSGDYTDEDDFQAKLIVWAEENEEQIQAKLDSQNRYINEIIAQSTLCGAILQIAAMGIKKYSRNKVIPDSCKGIVKIEFARKYCIGRIVNGLPIGLVIYAGRNQSNHLDDGKLRDPSQSIFDIIATIGPSKLVREPYKDPCFDTSNPTLDNYASNITGLLQWRDYDQYKKDMLGMLSADKI